MTLKIDRELVTRGVRVAVDLGTMRTVGTMCPAKKKVVHLPGATCTFCFEKHKADVRAWWKANGVELA